MFNLSSGEKDIGTPVLDYIGELKMLTNEFTGRIAFAKHFEKSQQDLDDDGKKNLKYEKLIPVLVKAIHELEARVATLEG